MSDAEEVEFSLKVMINKERNKVLFAQADVQFADILLSFLTLPLGRIVKVLKKHYGDDTPAIGSLSNLYHSLANLDCGHFLTEGAKQTLLNPTSVFEDEYKRLKLDITDSPPAEYFYCGTYTPSHNRFRSVSMYYDNANTCNHCGNTMRKEVAEKGSEGASSDGVLTIHKANFTISDDLQIFPNEIGLLQIISSLGITNDVYKAEEIQVSFGFDEIMKLLKASLTSPTPLSDVILNKTAHTNSERIPLHEIAKEENPNSGNLSLKVTIQKSTGKVLYAQAEEDFVEFLFSLLFIPLGGVEHLLGGGACLKAIDNLYRSTVDLVNDKYFKTPDAKNRLINPNLPHGCISKNHILPLAEECLPTDYSYYLWTFSSVKFPKGQGSYLKRPQTYKVTDDFTVTPYCTVSILSGLNKLKIPISDVHEMELQIGLKEGLSILKASLTSTSALTDALLNHISNKQPKPEL